METTTNKDTFLPPHHRQVSRNHFEKPAGFITHPNVTPHAMWSFQIEVTRHSPPGEGGSNLIRCHEKRDANTAAAGLTLE